MFLKVSPEPVVGLRKCGNLNSQSRDSQGAVGGHGASGPSTAPAFPQPRVTDTQPRELLVFPSACVLPPPPLLTPDGANGLNRSRTGFLDTSQRRSRI
jgi:hypothetical protein